MTPRSLFNIILKVLGIFFIQHFLAAIPQLLSVFSNAFKPEARQEAIWALVPALLLQFAYGIVSFYLIFRTDIVIDKLKLDKGFDQEAFSLNIHRSTVLSISIIVIGGLIVVDEIPNFCQEVVSYYEAKRITMGWVTQPMWISYVVLPNASTRLY